MRKITFLLVLLLSVYSKIQAQTEKGRRMLGTNVSFAKRSSTITTNSSMLTPFVSKNTNTSFSFGLNYGRFLTKNLDFGFLLDYRNSGQRENNRQMYENSNSIDAVLNIKKYILFDNRIGIRTGPYFGISNGKLDKPISIESIPDKYEFDMKGFMTGAIVDLVYFPSKKIGITSNIVSLNYERLKLSDRQNMSFKVNTLDFDFIKRFNLSVMYIFP